MSMHFTYSEIVYSEVRYLVLDPVEGGVVARAVLLLHEVGEVSHPGQLVKVRRGEVLWLQHQRDLELPLGDLHGPPDVLPAVAGVHPLPVGHQAGPAVVQESRQVDAVVPVRGEVFDVAVWEDGLDRRVRSLWTVTVLPSARPASASWEGSLKLPVGNER